MVSSSIAAVPFALIIVYALFKRFNRPSLSMIRGPKSPSFILGNLLELHQRPSGEADFAWQNEYGNVVRFKGILGEDQLLITDPKALQRILNVYSYARPTAIRVIDCLLNGNALIGADPGDHKRQKGIILPGFGPNECKSFLPIFRDSAESMCMKWSETIACNNGQGIVINVLEWLSRGALDALGRSAFDVRFGCIQDDVHPLAKKYKNCFTDVVGLPSATLIFIQAAVKHIPIGILHWMAENGSGRRLERVRDMKATVTSVAKQLLQEKADALLQGQGNKDIFSLLVKANMDATAKKKLSDEELYSNMRTLLLAGHETTANTVAWMLLELARNPNVQSKLRDEIRETEAAVRERGGSHLTLTDLDGMPYFNAVIKELLRVHPAASHALRVASEDDILPLSKPILTVSGEMINEVHVSKGTDIVISIVAYNRDKSLWGEDAHEFKPDRWLSGTMDGRKLPSLGVYSNLLSFSSGVRTCIGWRFAVIELQAFLATLVGKFEFGMTDKAERIIPSSAIAVIPLVDGELDRGGQMPLVVSLAP